MFRSASIPVVDVPVANPDRIALPESPTVVAEVAEVTTRAESLDLPAGILNEFVADAEHRAALRLLTEARDAATSTAAALSAPLTTTIPTADQITAAVAANTHAATLASLVDRARAADIPTQRWTADVQTYVLTDAARLHATPTLPVSLFEQAMQRWNNSPRGVTEPPRSTDADLAAEHASSAYNRERAGYATSVGLLPGLIQDVAQGHRHPLDVLEYVHQVATTTLPALLAQHQAAVDLIAAADAVRIERGL